MNNQENSNHDDLLDKATRALREAEVPAGPPDELVASIMAAAVAADHQPSSDTSTAPLRLGARIKEMKMIKKIAIAASLLVACSALFAWLAPGSQSLAFADMAKAFASVRTARFKMTTTLQGIPPQKSKGLFLAPAGERVEMEGIEVKGVKMPSTIMIFDMEKKGSISLILCEKLAIVYDWKNKPISDRPIVTFDKFRKQFQRAQQGEENTESLGKRTIDGKEAVGFCITDGIAETKIWADPKTKLPMLVEYKYPLVTLGKSLTIVMKDFEYGVELDKSLFDLTPPEDYRVEKQTWR